VEVNDPTEVDADGIEIISISVDGVYQANFMVP
jgi:hypothetical protein